MIRLGEGEKKKRPLTSPNFSNWHLNYFYSNMIEEVNSIQCSMLDIYKYATKIREYFILIVFF